jgi:uncharacterized protein (UPF0218 family)
VTGVVRLQTALRPELKQPMGPVYADAGELLAEAGSPLIAVGDVVTYHLLEADRTPNLAVVDGRTERSAVDPEVRPSIEGFDRTTSVRNPPATLTTALLRAIRGALENTDPTTLIDVDGEEDLATLPALIAAPPDASVVYGQPGEGMVHVAVDRETVEDAHRLLSRMDGDADRARALLDGRE